MGEVSFEPLKQLAQFYSGGTPSKAKPKYWNGDISWLTPKDMSGWTGETQDRVTNLAIGNGTRLAPANAIFVAVRGMSLHNEIRFVRAERAMAFNQDIKAIVPTDRIDRNYLYYALVSKRSELLDAVEAAGHGTGRLPTDRLEALLLPRFSQSNEREIGGLASALDDKIELNRRMNETLEAMARAIFRDWFVDFGPTRAKMEGREPYLPQDLWSLFPDKLDPATGLPDGWTEEPFLNHARIISGGTPKTENASYWDGPVAWASAKDVSQCGEPFLVVTERTITERGLEESATKLVPPFATVVVARGATTGRFCMFGRQMAMNQTCYGLASTSDTPFWLNCAFANLVNGLVHAAHGSVFDTITTGTLAGAWVTAAPRPVCLAFEQQVQPMYSRILTNILESRTLGETRDYLLPKLMSGEVRVRDAESMTGDAA
jgi:type I restriction enzyme S subunit